MSRVAAVLIDLSGTIHVEDLAIPRAIESLVKLRNSGKPIKFITNTTKIGKPDTEIISHLCLQESIRVLHTRLLNCGFKIDRSEIFTSLLAARRYVENRQLRPMLMLEPEAKEDFEGIFTDNPNAVVVGLAPREFEYNRLNDAFRLLLDGADLVAIHKAKYFKQSDGLSLGPGPFVTGLEYATGKTATVVGKPSADFFKLAVADLSPEIDLENTVMIGDDASDDVQGAIDAGMKGILVKTGKYREGDELRIAEGRRNCVPSFSEAVDLILSGKVL